MAWSGSGKRAPANNGPMSGFLDTSVVVRYLTGDSPNLADQAAAIIDSESSPEITDVVRAEAAHVLTSVYKIPHEAVVDHLIGFLQRENIHTYSPDKSLVLHSMLLCRPSGRVSFGDALAWATARSAGGKIIYSLDESFPADGLEVRKDVPPGA